MSSSVECEACAGTGRYGFRDDDECPKCHGSGSVESDEALKARCAAMLAGGRAVDITHPDYCSACDGPCLGH